MQIELEKKYNLSNHDLAIIEDKCEFVKEVILKDYYLDKNFYLKKNGMALRLRNGLYELKISSVNPENGLTTSEEYDNEEEIDTILEKHELTTDELSGILFIHTQRKCYTYTHEGQDINIDVEEFQYGTRYEIEIVYQEEGEDIDRTKKEQELNAIIDSFRKHIGLTAESNIDSIKAVTCAMHQNIELYEIMTSNRIK